MTLVRHLVIFARYPSLGTGKRRLARDIGATQAVRFQRVMLALTLRRLARDPRWTTWLAVTPDASGPWPNGVATVPQGRGDLGCRMGRVARGLPPGPVVIVGCDIPDMTAGHIAKAFRALGRCDAVFGPATDGGYWLMGLRRRPCFLDPFARVRWSTKHALRDSLANLAGRQVALIDTLSDVDDGAALSRVSRYCASGPAHPVGHHLATSKSGGSTGGSKVTFQSDHSVRAGQMDFQGTSD